jgi:hypothetical protein
LKKFVSGGTGLDIGAVIDEIPDRDARGELRHAAKVIAVPVSGNQVVDPYEPCVFDGGHNALGIPHSGCAGISGVDE